MADIMLRVWGGGGGGLERSIVISAMPNVQIQWESRWELVIELNEHNHLATLANSLLTLTSPEGEAIPGKQSIKDVTNSPCFSTCPGHMYCE